MHHQQVGRFAEARTALERMVTTSANQFVCVSQSVANFCRQRGFSPEKLVTIPNITHYGVYNEARPQCQKLAIEWFDTHLKNRQADESKQ